MQTPYVRQAELTLKHVNILQHSSSIHKFMKPEIHIKEEHATKTVILLLRLFSFLK